MPPKQAAAAATLLLFMAFAEAATTAACREGASAGGGVKGMFVFGSSAVDSGNNNFLRKAGARADYAPYGVDSPLGPSGRFSNGRNAIDALGEFLRLPGLVPPFADPATTGTRLLLGVNFASGGSGILDQTGLVTGEVTSLKQQISNFEAVTLPELRSQLNKRSNNSLDQCFLSEYLFVVATGGNDYLLNYFALAGSSNKCTPPLSQFTQSLISNFTTRLQRLYDLGARKFVIFSIQAIGCAPVARARLNNTDLSCAEPLNEAALLFNSDLKALAGAARPLMPGADMVYIDSYNIIKDVIDNPAENGIAETRRACCETSKRSEGILCEKNGQICGDRTKYVFFDGLHPTDALNARIAQKGYSSKCPHEVFPINVKDLALL